MKTLFETKHYEFEEMNQTEKELMAHAEIFLSAMNKLKKELDQKDTLKLNNSKKKLKKEPKNSILETKWSTAVLKAIKNTEKEVILIEDIESELSNSNFIRLKTNNNPRGTIMKTLLKIRPKLKKINCYYRNYCIIKKI